MASTLSHPLRLTLREFPKNEVPCPFCSGKIHFPEDEDGDHTCVLHTLPACTKFLMMPDDALDFVKACNLELAKRTGTGLA